MKEIEMRSKFKLSALTVIGVRVGSAVGTFAFASVLSHWMSKDDYGAVALLMTVVVFTGIIFNFGQRDLLIREVSKYLSNDDTASAYMFSKRSVSWSLVGGCLGGILVAIGFYVRGESLIFSLSAGLIVPLLSVNHTWAGCATSRKRFFWAIAPRDLLWRIIVLMIIGAYFWSYNGVLVGRDIAAPVILIVFLTLVLLQKFALGSSVAPFSLKGVTPAPELRKPSFNFCLGSLSGLGFVTLDVAVVGFMLGDLYAAEYFPANRISLFALFFYMALAMVINPDLSRKHTQGDKAGMQKLAALGAVSAAVPSAIFFFVLFLGQDYIFDLFGTATQATVYCALILSFGQLVCSMMGFAAQTLAMTGHDGKVAKVTMGIFLVAGALVPLASHFYGIVGTAISMTSLILVREVILYILCVKAVGIYSDCFSAVGILLRDRLK